MKRKLFLIGLVLVLVVLAAAPVMADAGVPSGTTTATGDVTAATITITAPSAINLGHFKVGDMTGSSSTPGTVTVTAGTAGYRAGIAYSVLAQDSNNNPITAGFMMNGTTPLSTTNKFMISSDGTAYSPADIGIKYTGNATDANPINLPYYVKQTIDGKETVGTYNITITLTASLPPPPQ